MAIIHLCPTIRRLPAFLLTLLILATAFDSHAQSMNKETFTVTMVPSENGSYTINPKIPENGQVQAGTVLTVKAKAGAGYALDAIYYTVKGGMWGTTSHEHFSSPMKITVEIGRAHV